MSGEVEHGLLFEKITVDETVTRDGERTVALRAHHQVSRHTSTTSVHLSVSAAMALYVRLGDILLRYLEEDSRG